MDLNIIIIEISKELNIQVKAVETTINLMIEQECTVPFIARYRKEMTGGLDEVQIRNIFDLYEDINQREKRREFILDAINKLEQLTPDLEKTIKLAKTLTELEEIYKPYKLKKKTKAQVAKDAGLQELANLILTKNLSDEELILNAKKFLGKHDKFKTQDDIINGAIDIVTETIYLDADLKQKIRDLYWSESKFLVSKRKDAETVKDFEKFKDYFEYDELFKNLLNEKNTHRYLAIRRGVSLKVLKSELTVEQEKLINMCSNKYINSNCTKECIEKAIKKALITYIHPSIDLELRAEVKKIADQTAIDIFKKNLKNLLLMPYLGSKPVLGIDPGVRTGCKIVVVDSNGNLLFDDVIYPHKPQNDIKGSAEKVRFLVEKFNINHIAIGDGTFGRETLQFISNLFKDNKKINCILVNEAGASVYSASDIAREEFPKKDVTVRGAVSIARRLQDPLAELVKIDPKSIGVGQYQHDVSQLKLKKGLGGVVEDCVNYVGVDLNTASDTLLGQVSGIGKVMAKNIVTYRHKKGGFKNRNQLLEIPRFSDKVFQMAAGFLRIYNGANPLDSTFIHPEQYSIIEKWASSNNIAIEEIISNKENIKKLSSDKKLKETIGEFTFEDILKSLKAPSQDPREEFKNVEFRSDINEFSDLKVGMRLSGIVNNITQFGAFINIGIKESGLLHISQMADQFIENPLDHLKVGEEVKVTIIDIDKGRKRISLSAKGNSDSQGHTGSKDKKILKSKKTQTKKSSPFDVLDNLKFK